MKNIRHIYYVSENTGLLAKDSGKSLLCQFPGVEFQEELLPFIRTKDDAQRTINAIREKCGEEKPIIFSTIFDPEINKILQHEDVILLNICEPFLTQLEGMLGKNALRASGHSRNVDQQIMSNRVDAIHYTISHDDGTAIMDYEEADLIIVGVSRSGKTPISVFLATQMGIKTANYPLVEQDLTFCQLPEDIIKNKHKVVGLSISPDVLHTFREQRYKGSHYAQMSTCKRETLQSKRIFEKYDLPVVFSDARSIEETATQVAQELSKQWNPIF
ncbi:pyruvate, phosphate dikinase/phosphoenolpyruvate synthase regulator [Desulfotalea psychrophila]|uniref:Putative phosphoenolpyruvate synthase regulatory protein n=1 Tax=Desulfotalea psychrophila (strain LSv54 / DSM 12343) TaxID=177439 RepID=PSRP_DESPS|nr:pyruvate, phosphate dikinase/phosphoenolpyruvate synthase regulator [Desulfotalea psychrophila]Q6AK68.1 RecName: Full=Putative phosphoenolpyruvate synthase regulatory protein; Short=PEP synthase regulatory protein; Short=PSRP; AltName: Full=Pyruvate, water dikinase regulatory protein [Desulfotalea psychrophila LSv54]CAG37258.1 conserved hypothetical protein [Desulfotalea psychrophila LSv54]